MSVSPVSPDILKTILASNGQSLWDISVSQPVLLVFLRHFGCTFCRQALAELSKKRLSIEEKGFQLILVHMSDQPTATKYFNKYNLSGVLHVQDPDCKYYAAFGLVKGTFQQLFGWSTWIRGFESSILEGHGTNPLIGDGFQMPGVFVLKNGLIEGQFIHQLVSDRPNYDTLLDCCTIQ
jgi:hypothetical protein